MLTSTTPPPAPNGAVPKPRQPPRATPTRHTSSPTGPSPEPGTDRTTDRYLSVDQVAVLLTGAKTITAKAYRLLEGIVETAVDLDTLRVRVRLAELERMNGRRVPGDTKSEAGTRTVILPAFLCRELRWHLESRAEAGPEGLLFVGEKGAPFRRSAFGRKWRRAREIVGMPEDFRSYGLRHTGHALSTRSGATLKDTMVRAGQSSEKAALIYQHSDDERQEELAAGLDATVRKARAATTEKAPDKRSGAVLARIWHAATDHHGQQKGPGL